MISLSRIKAMILRHAYLQFREIYRIAETIYWPVFDMLLWGFTGSWAQKNSADPLLLQIVTGMALWQFYYRNNLEISQGVLEEIWEKNIVNLFSTPLQLTEWIIGLIFVAIVRSLLSLTACALVAKFVFGINLFALAVSARFIIWLALLALFGWISGLFSSLFLFRFGRQVTSLVWINAWIVAPFSGALFPINTLPLVMQNVARGLPLSYIFLDMRNVITQAGTSWHLLVTSFVLNSVFAIFVGILLKKTFNDARAKGLNRLI